jgi:ParB-like chromosome segregation protein Spo0J
MLQTISLAKLHPDPRNANHCPPDTLAKIKTHIQQSGFCPALIVRPHPKKRGHYILVDGHHRFLVLQELGWRDVTCQVKPMTEEESGIYLLTLNRLRGTDIPRKRAELIQDLLPHFSITDLADLLPENVQEIEGLLALMALETEALEKQLQAQLAEEEHTLPVPFGFMIPAADAETVRAALHHYQTTHQQGPEMALISMCHIALQPTHDKGDLP